MTILITAATELEMQAFTFAGKADARIRQLITGIGPTETALTLTTMLLRQAGQIDLVLNFGIAGAYPASKTELLDICLAEQEVLGDLGICLPERIERLSERGLKVKDSFLLDSTLRQTAEITLQKNGIAFKKGVFVTVNCASGTQERAQQLGRQFHALCENMEGGAAARVCEEFALPLLEIRSVSNVVGERDRKKWQIADACQQVGRAVTAVVSGLLV